MAMESRWWLARYLVKFYSLKKKITNNPVPDIFKNPPDTDLFLRVVLTFSAGGWMAGE